MKPGYEQARRLRPDVFTPHWALTEAGAWFLGLFVTDGYLSEGGRLTLSLQVRDRSTVIRAAKTVGLDEEAVRERISGNSHQAQLALTVWPYMSRLWDLGIEAGAKTGREACPEILQNSRHFWRGAIEGDGWVTAHREIGLCSTSVSFLDQFDAFCFSVTGACPRRNLVRRPGLAVWKGQLGVQASRELARHTWTEVDYFMDRKRERALAAAAYQPRRYRQHHRNAARLAEISQSYRSGLNLNEIATARGESSGSVHYALVCAGVPRRSPGRPRAR